MSDHRLLREWLVAVRGRRLMRTLMERFVGPDGLESASAVFVWLHFEGRPIARVSSRHGEAVGIDLEPPLPKDMGDAGSTVVLDVSQEQPFGGCVGRVVSRVALVREKGVDECAGFELTFENGCSLSIVNVGDELSVGRLVQSTAPACEWESELL